MPGSEQGRGVLEPIQQSDFERLQGANRGVGVERLGPRVRVGTDPLAEEPSQVGRHALDGHRPEIDQAGHAVTRKEQVLGSCVAEAWLQRDDAPRCPAQRFDQPPPSRSRQRQPAPGSRAAGIGRRPVQGVLHGVEAVTEQAFELAQPRLDTRARPPGPVMPQRLVERGQRGESGPEPRPRRGPFGRGGAFEPGRNVPEPAPLLVHRPAIESRQGDRDEPQASRLIEPAMDLLQPCAAGTVPRPGARHQPPPSRFVPPEPCAAVAPGVTQGFRLPVRSGDRRIPRQQRRQVVAPRRIHSAPTIRLPGLDTLVPMDLGAERADRVHQTFADRRQCRFVDRPLRGDLRQVDRGAEDHPARAGVSSALPNSLVSGVPQT